MAVRNGNCQCSDPVLGPLYCLVPVATSVDSGKSPSEPRTTRTTSHLSFNKRRRMFKASPHIWKTPTNVTMTITKKHVKLKTSCEKAHFRNATVFETGLESGILQNSYFEAPGAREISSSTQSSAVRIPPSSTQLPGPKLGKICQDILITAFQ